MRGSALGVTVWALMTSIAAAQSPPQTICGLPVPAPATMPEAGPTPVIVALMLCFDGQDGVSSVEPATYLHYIQLKPSEASLGTWRVLDDEAERVARDDFGRLWATGFLDDLAIETVPYPFANGAHGVVVVYRLHERQRVKLVEYEGLDSVSQTDVLDALKEKGITLRLDAFLDPLQVRRAATAIRELLAKKGFPYGEVTPHVAPLPDNPQLARVRFDISEGPKVAIRAVQFVGNVAFADDALRRVLKTSRPRGLLSLVAGGGTYDETAFADDAVRIEEFYRNHGYIEAKVGQQSLRVLDDSADGRTRWVQLRVPVSEGARFRVGTVAVDGQTVFPADTLAALFGLKTGEVYSQERVRKGFERARDVYGAAGYFEFTAYPDITPRGPAAPAIADVTIRIQEGKPYTVHRIEFTGNSQTRDDVIRRELGIAEGASFNTEALKYSLRRINQLGYFKPLDDAAVDVKRVSGTDDKVDVTIAVEEQNRNQLQFGAGMSQYEGVFGNLSFTTANLLGRGESLTVAAQAGTRSRNYQLAFTEPFIFGRALSLGGSVYSRKVDFAVNASSIDYSEVRSGVNATTGMSWRRFTRLFFTYGFEIVDTAMTDELSASLGGGATGPTLLAQEGRFTESSVTPSLVYNTVDNPFAPRQGMRLSATYQYAGGWLGGSSRYVRPDVQAIVYVPLTRRTALGVRANAGAIWNLSRQELPFYQRYFLGGEQQIRGVNVRSVGPLSEANVATGGTRFALLNVEAYYDVLSQVRALLFHDAGQAFGEREAFDLRNLRTSSGVELRVNVPMLNVPFRLIYAWNVYRDAFQPARALKFAVGTTF
jgi:outer membrane protein insertion porin family